MSTRSVRKRELNLCMNKICRLFGLTVLENQDLKAILDAATIRLRVSKADMSTVTVKPVYTGSIASSLYRIKPTRCGFFFKETDIF
jgi:hypothetical protein